MERGKDKEKAGALAEIVGRNLHGLRMQRDLTLDELSRISKVSRAMLWQIERARSAPTITVLSRVAEALGVPVSLFLNGAAPQSTVVLRRCDSRVVQAEDGAVVTRALFPLGGSRTVEFYELKLRAGATESLKGGEGTFENIVIHEGSVRVEVGTEKHLLGDGDAFYFRADAPYAYHNVSRVTALIYRVILRPAAVTHD
jgi:transcriptional regulator with XRE-family HTH domain